MADSPSVLSRAAAWGHEEVLLVRDREAGLHAVIALHDTTLGPAVGGTRMRAYATFDDAVLDALRLSRAMTAKAALAGMDCGGGKAVIVGDPGRDKTRALLGAYAQVLERLGGRFQTGCDMGLDARDIAVLARTTRWVSHTPAAAGVDTAELAALGVFESIRAAADELDRPVDGLHVAVQGLGEVGRRLAEMLSRAGARLTVADLDAARAERAAAELGAFAVPPERILDVEADVFSPNASGPVIDDAALARLRCRAVVGAANEQLAEDRHGEALHARGILYGPDYLVNAGGLLSLLFERGEVDEAGIVRRVRAIGGRLRALWREARGEGISPHRMAERRVAERLAAARAARAAREER